MACCSPALAPTKVIAEARFEDLLPKHPLSHGIYLGSPGPRPGFFTLAVKTIQRLEER